MPLIYKLGEDRVKSGTGKVHSLHFLAQLGVREGGSSQES